MRILFSSLGLHGHTYPLLPLAIAARELGHDVTYFTGAAFANALTSHGIEHVEGGIDLRAAFEIANEGAPVTKPQDADPDRIAAAFASVLPRAFAAELAPVLADLKPDLVVHELGNPGAGLAAKVAGVPGLCHSFGRAWVADEFASSARRRLLDVAADLGVEVPENDPMGLGNPYIDICPPSVQEPGFLAGPTQRIPLRPVPFAEPGELPPWVLEHREPLVYLTLGTAFGEAGVLRTAIDGLAGVGAKVLVAAGPAVDVGGFGELPDNVVVLPWVPQADLLPHVDLVVHHGGSGTTMGTFGVGVPQLVLPQGADQFSNAAVVAAAGLGDQLLGADVTAEAIAAKARHLLADEAVLGAARAIADEVAAMPSPHDVARTLPEYA
ncbi:glycosyltransferase family 1 protein [Saccharothrix sp. 6-C]|uniref:MGT family glycosyltransferase n=1 Tax=Saccharothrix texasensis TaxID=103734 RepID=A0A3N1HJC9_9PSEU|nr:MULTISPECIES: glycosyltransferase [Saccharothrix]QQQ73603.1 glycosyltransferase family 1 protein [Saccharothrix sp. 6-C]ROP42551.1 MGT family glycosyltransferase [Saccharothrix texasensis]